MKLENFLQKTYGYNPEVKDNIQTYISQWYSWYIGNVRNFHNYYIYNGNKKVKQQRYTMNMAKEISEDWSDILWSEKCKISLKNEKSQKEFDDLINELDLYTLINQSIEKSGALGTCAVVTSVYDIIENQDGMTLDVSEAKTRIDSVDVEQIYPLSWNNKGITECAFGSAEYFNGQKYVVCSVHKLNEQGNYVIYNHLFKDDNSNLVEVTTEQDNTLQVFDTRSNVKWFSIFKPLLTNNLFSNNPFGIPHYANAIDNMKSVDICFDTIKHEVNTGRRRIFASAEMFNYDAGEQRLTFDPNDVSIYQLPKGANSQDMLQSENSEFRTTSLIDTLNNQLNILGNKVGFGENHYHFDGQTLSTATAVVSSNSKMFRRKKKLEIGYESAIFDLVNAICYASSKFGKYNIDTADMVIQFDDSIIEDKEAESVRASREVSQGLISKIEYRMRIFGETEEIAKKKIEEIEEETPNVDKLLNDEEDNTDNNKDKQDDNKDDKKSKEKEEKE